MNSPLAFGPSITVPAGQRFSTANGSILLGSTNNPASGSAGGNFSALENVFVMSETPMPSNGQFWDLGRGLAHRGPGVTTFTASNAPGLPEIGTLLTDGVDEFVELDTFLSPGGGGGGFGSSESHFFAKTPDFVGYAVDFVRLNITSLKVNYTGGITNYSENSTWEVWGHPLFVFFVPPTDPNGAYLIDRSSTEVRAALAGPGAAALEWDGVNRSMVSNGANWSATVAGLANGLYMYRVWASNATGAIFATPVRDLTVGVGIWRTEKVGYGFWPSVAVNAMGSPHLCYYGAAGLVYAERRPAGWTNTTIGGGGSGCSLAFNSKGEARISYLSGPSYDGNFDISYARQTGTAWSTTVIQRGFYTPTSIAINPMTDEPMVAYSQATGEGLKLATLSGGNWSTQVVDRSFYGETTSLAIDSAGRPAIAYPDYTAGTLRVARWTGSAWNITTLDSQVTDASIQFDAREVAHVAFASPIGLMYATWNGTAWLNEQVDSGRYYGVSLVFDSLGRAHIGYSMGWGGDVRQAVKDGAWRIEVITHRNGNGKASLAVMPQGTAVAAFDLNDTNGDLVIASDIVDTQAPVTRVLVNGTTGLAGWYRSPVTVRLEAQDDWSGVGSIEYRLDGGSWTRYAGPFRVSAESRHVLVYRATDLAGNVEGLKTTSVDVDLTPPTVSILAPTGTVTSSSVTIQWRGEDTLSGIGGYELAIDGEPATSVGLRDNVTVTLGLGPHTISVRTTDVAGSSATTMVQIVVDTNVLSFSGPYRGLPTIALVMAPVAVGAVAILLERRKQKLSPLHRSAPERPKS